MRWGPREAPYARSFRHASRSSSLSSPVRYASVDEVHRLLPQSRQYRDALLSVFELDKAVYELAYELAHRPELADVPAAAVAQMLDSDPPLPEFPAGQ